MNEDQSKTFLRMVHSESSENVGSSAFANADDVRNSESVDNFCQTVTHRSHIRKMKTDKDKCMHNEHKLVGRSVGRSSSCWRPCLRLLFRPTNKISPHVALLVQTSTHSSTVLLGRSLSSLYTRRNGEYCLPPSLATVTATTTSSRRCWWSITKRHGPRG